MEAKEITADWIKERRIEKGYTQEKLGELLQVDRQLISKYERGKRNPANPTKIALWYILRE